MSRANPTPHFSKRHITHRLRVLLGNWKVAGHYVGGDEVLKERGTVTFRWLEKDALLLMRSRMRVAPRSIAAIGADDGANNFTILYSDERNVVRRMEMTLTARRWTWIRRQRGFMQRFTGRISTNGRRILATIEKSADGRRWIRDFDLVYAKPIR
jgi:hypothetical protein